MNIKFKKMKKKNNRLIFPKNRKVPKKVKYKISLIIQILLNPKKIKIQEQREGKR